MHCLQSLSRPSMQFSMMFPIITFGALMWRTQNQVLLVLESVATCFINQRGKIQCKQGTTVSWDAKLLNNPIF